MRVVSVNAGLPREVRWRGRLVRTSIFKEPVAGRVAIRALNLAGDRQADPTVHGGPDKAVYAYHAEHYDFWREQLPGADIAWGSFGENLTIAGLPAEDETLIGDRLRVGSALLAVTQPRLPCFKLGLRFGRADMVKRFLASGRTSFYLAVVEEGDVAAGDEVALVERGAGGVTVADVTRLYAHDRGDLAGMRRAAQLEALPPDWRNWFSARLADAS